MLPLETSLSTFLSELFAGATREASVAMSSWTGGAVSLSLEEVRELPLEEAALEFNFGDEPHVNVVLTLGGDLPGVMILLFDQASARELAASFTGEAAPENAPWDALARSALEETGNILSCAYLNALTEALDAPLTPSPPYFLEDFASSVLQQALMGQATCENALICHTVFHRHGRPLDWNVFFFPSPELRERLRECGLRQPLGNPE